MKKFFFQTVILGAALSLGAENLFYNGSFELGLDGVSMIRQLRPDTNPKLEFVPLTLAPGAPGEGKNSLLFRNQSAESYRLYFREFLLKPDTDYVLEFKTRCASGTVPGKLCISRVKSNDHGSLDWTGTSHDFTITEKWQTVKKYFNSKKSRLDGYSHCFIMSSNQTEQKPCDLYFDGFKLHEVKSKPDGTVNIAVTTKEHLTVADRIAKVPVEVKIGNFSKEPFAGKVTLSAVNDWDGKTLTREFEVKLAPGEIKTFPKEFPLYYGCWTLKAAAPGVRETATLDGSIAVIGKYEQKKLDLNHDFCISFNGGLMYDGYPSYRHYGYVVNNVPLETVFKMYSQMGCRMLREHDTGYETTCWVVFEPEENKFDFRHFDYSLKLYEKYNIECFPCLGRINFLRAQPHNKFWWTKKWPEWVDKQCHEVEYASYNWGGGPKGYCFLPPMKLWRKFVRTVATRAKGRIHFYEIFNEANGVMSSKSYTPVMKAAYEEVKKADPDAKVIGICVTEDFGAKTSGFVNEILDQKGGDYMDIASFHPYTSRELGSPNPADQLIGEFRTTLKKKTGKDFPLWNTELYYIYDTPNKNGSAQGTVRPNHIALRILTDLGEGVKQSASLNSNQIWKRRLIPHHAFRTNVEQIPDYNFVVNNALARFFEAARPAAKHRLPGGVIIYGFRKDGHGIAAIWNYERRKGIKADLAAFTVYDLFGNEMKSGVLPVTDVPYYLKPGKNMSDAAFFEALGKMKFAVERPVLVSNQVRQAGNWLFGTLINQTGDELSGFAGFRGDGITAVKTVPFKLPPRGKINVTLPLKQTTLKTAPAFSLFVNGQLMTNPVSVVKEQYVKGGETVKLGGNSNFAGSWKMTKKDGRLHFFLQVKDATDSGKKNKNHPWEQDCAELFLDFDPLSLPLNHAEAYTPEVVRLFLLPRLTGDKRLQIWSEKKLEVKTAFKKTADGYEIVVSMPCKADAVGFALKLNNANPGAKTHEDLRFTAGKDTHVNRLHFNVVDFK